MQPTTNIHVRGATPLIAPRALLEQMPITEAGAETVVAARDTIIRVIQGHDRRLLLVVGPCSLHEEAAALEYARRLKKLADRVADRLYVVMRVYFEKPRTTTGWKGLINEPYLNGEFNIHAGLCLARRLLQEIIALGLPTATEMLDPITPQYIADHICWASIGARTIESPTHRQMASGLSMPVGYKNGTDGSLDGAVNAMVSAATPHAFLGIDLDGRTCVIQTTGNPHGHLILRGGASGPNYSAQHVAAAVARMEKAKLAPRLVVDCSHGNSNKDHRRQAAVWADVLEQRRAGNEAIIGMMLESNLEAGRQDLNGDSSKLAFGVSITDACIGWDETEKLILDAHARHEVAEHAEA